MLPSQLSTQSGHLLRKHQHRQPQDHVRSRLVMPRVPHPPSPAINIHPSPHHLHQATRTRRCVRMASLINSNGFVCILIKSPWLYLFYRVLAPGEEYWERQSQNYMAELAATGTQPTSSLGVNAQATLLSGSAIPQQPHVQHHMPLPAAQFEPADAVPSAQHPPSSIETQTLLNPQSSGNDLPNTAITKQEFIRRFQIVSEVGVWSCEFLLFLPHLGSTTRTLFVPSCPQRMSPWNG